MNKVIFNPLSEILDTDFNRQAGYVEYGVSRFIQDFMTENMVVVWGLGGKAQAIADMTIYVSPGRLYQDGKQGELTSNSNPPLAITASHPDYDRIDRVCARYAEIEDEPETRNVMIDTVSRQVVQKTVMTRRLGTIEFIVISGAPAPVPAPPTVPDGWISLAKINVKAKAINIVQENISDERPTISAYLKHAHTGSGDGARIDYSSLKGLPDIGEKIAQHNNSITAHEIRFTEHNGLSTAHTAAFNQHNTNPQAHATGIAGNSATATKLQTSRTISLSGDVTGSGQFDGSSDMTIETTINSTGESIGHIGITLSNIPEGCLTLDTGATVSRSTYPELWEFVQSSRNLLPVVTESQWQTMASAQTSVAAFSTGGGSTTFRLPKLIGWMKGGTQAQVGTAIEAGLPNVTGRIQGVQHTIWSGGGGCFQTETSGRASMYEVSGGGNSIVHHNIDASRSSPIYGNSTTVQPAGVTGIYYIRAFHGAVNQGNVDLTELANELEHKVNTDEVGFTIIYPNGGTNITGNSRYILPNPFHGSHVICVAEIQYSGKWNIAGWGTFAQNDISRSYGVIASHVAEDDVIVVQTGKTAVVIYSSFTGNGLGIPESNSNYPASAPCRVKVWKIGGKIS